MYSYRFYGGTPSVSQEVMYAPFSIQVREYTLYITVLILPIPSNLYNHLFTRISSFRSNSALLHIVTLHPANMEVEHGLLTVLPY